MPTADGYERMANKLVALQKKRQPRPTPRFVAPTPSPARRESRTIFGQPVDYDRNANVGKAIAGTALGLFDVPVQAIGGMHRDAVSGNQAGGQSSGSRAVGDYGNLVRNLWSDVFRPGAGQTEPFLPREFEAAGEAAVDRFGLEGAGASAARGGATALDLLTGLGAGGVGAIGRRGATVAADDASRFVQRIPGTFQPETAYYSSLLRRIMDDPDTALTTVRSMDSAEDIIGGSGVFKSSNNLGTSGSQAGGTTPELYDRLRNTFETNINLDGDVAYGAFTSPVLRSQPAPLPLGSRGRQNFLTHQKMASMFDPYGTGSGYGAGPGRTPMRYILNNDVLNNAGISFGDSLRGAPSFNSYDDFVASLNRGGYDEIMSTPGKADWGWLRVNNTLNFPEYIEAQIPNLSIDDVARVVGMGEQPLDAAQSAMKLSDIVASSGRDIPVGALSNRVPREVSAGTTETKQVVDALRSNPQYEEIIDALISQRGDFLPPGKPNTTYRYNNMGNTAYASPNWAVGHSLRQMGEDTGQYSPSAVVNYLQNAMTTQIAPKLRAFQQALFPEVRVPKPSTLTTRPAFYDPRIDEL
jgi:hypothetical protein